MEKQELAKIAITPESDAKLVQAFDRINEDKTFGKVTKTELASWFIGQSATALNDASVEEIRMAHFSQVAYLESLIKTVKRSGRDDLSQDELEKFQAMFKKITTQKKRASEVVAANKKPSSGS